MQSHRSWQPFNVNAGVKGEAEGFCCKSRFMVRKVEKRFKNFLTMNAVVGSALMACTGWACGKKMLLLMPF
jgi:TPP-dependent pyruvate/acetoin dehydrogenase alpha subunit